MFAFIPLWVNNKKLNRKLGDFRIKSVDDERKTFRVHIYSQKNRNNSVFNPAVPFTD